MPKIIDNFKSFIAELENFDKAIPHQTIQDKNNPFELNDEEFLTSGLILALKVSIEQKSEDIQVKYHDLQVVHDKCLGSLNTALDKLVSTEIKPFCDSQLKERDLLLIKVTNFIMNCKTVTDVGVLNVAHIDPNVIAFCQTIYHTKDALSYIHNHDFKELFEMLRESGYFSFQKLIIQMNLKQKEFKNQFFNYSIAREAVQGAKPKFDGLFTISEEMTFKLRRLETYHKNLSSSAPSLNTSKDPMSNTSSRTLTISRDENKIEPKSKTALRKKTHQLPERTITKMHSNVPPLCFSNLSTSNPETTDNELSQGLHKLNIDKVSEDKCEKKKRHKSQRIT